MASDVKIWTGAAWESIKGPKGDPGPTAVSADAGNTTTLGSDGKVFTPTASTTVAGSFVINNSGTAILQGSTTRVPTNAAVRDFVLDALPDPSTVAGQADTASGAAGTSALYARADHSHPRPTLAELGAAAATHTHTAAQVTGLATVATTGSYNDLTNRPTIPAAYTLPVATTTVLGGVKQGTGVTIAADGTLTVSSGGGLPVNNPTYTGRIAGPDGTLAAPSYTFTNDTDTGMFRVGNNVMQIVAGGKSAIQVSDTGYMQFYATVLEMISDVAFAPSIQIRNTNAGGNGCYFNLEKRPPGNVMTAGAELATIQFQGVDTGGTPRMGAMMRAVVDNQGASHCAADLVFFTTNTAGNTAERLRIDSDNGVVVRQGLTVQGATSTFTAQSINSDAIGPLQFNTRTTDTAYTLTLADAGKVVVGGNGTQSLTVTIPPDNTTNFPIGTVIELIDNSPFDTFIKGGVGVTVNYNLLTGSTYTLGGGVAARAKLLGRLSSCRILKAAANTWWLFGELATG